MTKSAQNSPQPQLLLTPTITDRSYIPSQIYKEMHGIHIHSLLPTLSIIDIKRLSQAGL